MTPVPESSCNLRGCTVCGIKNLTYATSHKIQIAGAGIWYSDWDSLLRVPICHVEMTIFNSQLLFWFWLPASTHPERQEEMPQVVDPLAPSHRRLRLRFRLLTSTWPSPGCCGNLQYRQVDKSLCSLCSSFFFSVCLSNKNSNKLVGILVQWIKLPLVMLASHVGMLCESQLLHFNLVPCYWA